MLFQGGTVKIGSEEPMDEDKSDDPCVEYVFSDTGLYFIVDPTWLIFSHWNQRESKG